MKRPAFHLPAVRILATATLLGMWANTGAANTESDLLLNATALDASASYLYGMLPSTSSDLTFISGTYVNTSFTINNRALSIGSLDDRDATQALTISAAQNLTLNGGSDSVAGSVANDLLYLASGANLTYGGTGSIILAANGNFDTAGTAQANISAQITGGSVLNKTGTGLLTLSGANAYTGGTVFTAGTLNVGSAGALGGSGPLVFNGGTLQYSAGSVGVDFSSRFSTDLNQAITIDTNGQNVAFGYSFGGAAGNGISFTKLGAGTLTLSGANTYTGATSLNGGVVSVNNPGALGVGGTISFAGGTLQYGDNSHSDSQYNAADYSARFSTAANQAFSIDTNGHNITFATGLASTGGTLAKLGAGTLTLSGASTYTGNAAVNGGTLAITGSVTSGNNSYLAVSGAGASATLSVSGTGSLSVGGIIVRGSSVNMLNQSGGTVSVTTNGLLLDCPLSTSGIYNLSGGSLEVVGGLTAGNVDYGTFNQTGGSVTLDGSKLALGDSIQGNGVYNLNGGVLTAGSVQGGAGTSTFHFNGGTLQAGASTTSFFTGLTTADVQAGGAKLDTQGYAVTVAQSLVHDTSANAPAQDGGLTKLGTGTLTLSGANTYTGGTTLSAGTLDVGSMGALGSTGVLSFTGGTLQFSAANTTDYSARFSQAASQAYSIDTNGQAITFATGLASTGGTLAKLGAGTLTLAGASTYTGNTTVSAGTLAITGSVDSGIATVTVNGRSESAATLNLSGTGSLNADRANVGLYLDGTVNQSGGTFTVNTLTLAGGPGGSGTYVLNGGSLNAGTTFLGSSSGGTFTQNGGTFTAINLFLGFNNMGDAVGNGTYNLSGGTLNMSGQLCVGYAGTGTFTQSGGSATTNGNSLLLANNTGSSGTYNLSVGTLSTGAVYAGYNGTGSFTQSGGSITTNGNLLFLAYSIGSSGTYNLSGGTLSTGAAYVGYGGTGKFTQTAGNFTTSGAGFYLGYQGSADPDLAGSGTYNLSGGTLSTGPVYVGCNSNGVFTQTGGSFTTNGNGLILGEYSLLSTSGPGQGTGTYNLNGGVLTAGSVQGGAGTSTFHFNGGTLQAGGSSTGFMQSVGTADVQAGGAKFDTQGYAVTVAQSLVHDTSANAPAQDGGLTKLGTGTLTLSGANTYTGGTTLSAGTLLVANTSGSGTGTGAVTIGPGGTLGGTGRIAGAVTAQQGGTVAPGIAGPGRLTLAGALNLNSGSTLAVELGGLSAGTGYDQLAVGGQLTLGGNLQVSVVNGFALGVGQTFNLLVDSGDTLVTGTFANAIGGTLYTDSRGDTFIINYAANVDGGLVPNDVTLTVMAVVPEPPAWAQLALGAAGLGVVTLRRRPRRA